jgi:Fe-S cluster assembly protein SufD
MIAADSKERYLTAFEQWQSNGNANAPVWLKELRRSGIASFAALGFPTTKNEDWKYTSVEPIASLPVAQANGAAATVSHSDVVVRSFADAACPRLVFINGAWVRETSSPQDLPQGVRLASLAELVARDDPLLPTELGRYANHSTQPFVALNTAFMGDGAVVLIPPGRRLNRPIYLIYASTGGAGHLVSYPRTLIFLGAGSEAKIVESYVGVNGGTYFCNAVTELVAGPGALVEHHRLQREGPAAFHIGTLEADLKSGARLTAHAVTLSGSLVRNNVRVSLNGEGAECVLNGLYLAGEKQHIDNFTEIDHLKPRATSFELYKGILDGAAHGVFNGKIVVHKNAQKSDARQVNKNLLLSEHAAVNTKPQLEIYADDVKCSHGSTIGQMDADALFYLRSRGLGLEEARSLLSFAFATDIIGRIKIDSLRRQLEDYLVAKFARREWSHEGSISLG